MIDDPQSGQSILTLNDHASLGAVSFQGYTLVAMAGYSLLTAGIAKLVSITRY